MGGEYGGYTSLTKEEQEAIEEITNMKQLYLLHHSIEVGAFMGEVYSSFNFLTVINLSYTNLENEGAVALVNALKSSAPSLQVIELAGNNITDEAAPAIAACLAAKPHLKKLNLSQNDLQDEGCVDIVQSMEDLELEYVDMSYNKLTRGGALDLAHVVVKKEYFKMLNIDGNMISVRGIEEVKEIFKNCPKLLGPLDEIQNEFLGEDSEEDHEENESEYIDDDEDFGDDDDDDDGLREDLEDCEEEFVHT